MRLGTLLIAALLSLPPATLIAQSSIVTDSATPGAEVIVAVDSGAALPWMHAEPVFPEAGPRLAALGLLTEPASPLSLGLDTVPARRHAVEVSEGYAIRLKIHQIGAFAELPLFAGEYILGQKLLNDERTIGRPPRSLRNGHRLVATGLGVLFAVNTVTGVWNLLETRHQPAGRTLRTLHAIGMLVADAGFFYTSSLAHAARRTDAGAINHRNAAIASISVATASTLMMWIFKH